MTTHQLSDGTQHAVPPSADARPATTSAQSRAVPGGHPAPVAAPDPVAAGDPDKVVLARWRDGGTVREIADELGLNRADVMEVVAADVAARAAAGPAPPPPAPLAPPRPSAAPAERGTQRYRSPRSITLTDDGASAAGVVQVELVAVPVLTREGLREMARQNRRQR